MVNKLKRKEALTSLDIAVLSRELNEFIGGGWIDNVYSGDEGGLLFKVRTSSGILKYVVAVPGSRVNLTRHVGKSGIRGRVPIFRRFVRNARIVLVRQYEFERIMIAELKKSGRDIMMISELIPRGVIAVVNPADMKVLVSDRDLKVKDRSISPGKPYIYPPTFPDPRKLEVQAWAEKLSPYRGLGKGLVRGLGLPPEIVNEVLDPSIREVNPAELTLEKLGEVRDKILGFIAEVVENPEPSLIYCGDTPVSFHPYIPSVLPEGCEIRRYGSFNDVVDEYFSMLNPPVAVGEGESERMRTTLMKARENVDRLREELGRVRSILNVFESYYDVIESSWRCVREKVKALGWSSVMECPGVIEVNPKDGTFTLSVGAPITLSVKKDVKAQYFDLRRKEGVLRKKIGRAEESLKELMERLESVVDMERAEREIKQLKRRVEWYHQYHWLMTKSGLLAIGGRDAQQNEKIVSKYLRENDIFIHAEIHGGSAFVLRSGGPAPQEDLREVGVMAVSYSKGWLAGAGSLDAFWVWGSQVSKSPPPGQFLPKGSFMIYGRKNYLRGLELKVSVGIKVTEGRFYEVVAGPPELIGSDSEVVAYLTLIPGGVRPHEIGVELLSRLKGLPCKFEGLTADDISLRVPGPSRIAEVVVRGC